MTPDSLFVARNIVNQLADLWEVPAKRRQETNDQADRFVHKLLCKHAAEELRKVCSGGRAGAPVSIPAAQPDLRDCHGRVWRWNPWRGCYQNDNDIGTCLRDRSTIEEKAGPVTAILESREALGRVVRQVWVEWAREQPNPKPSWLTPWEDLDDGQREVDMRIGEALFTAGKRAASDA